jgi:4-aminobutyrate aminotransferase
MASLQSEGDLNLSLHRRAWQEAYLDTATRQLLEADAAAYLHQSLSTPCLNAIRRADGVYLEDVQGRRILDFHGNNVHHLGYGHPRVAAAITRQMTELPFCPRRYTNEPAVRLAQRLAALAPGDLNRVLLAPGGTTAMGMALKLARVATGRFKTISMWESFHGASLDMISLGGEAVFRRGIGPLLPGTEHVPPPDAWHCPWECAGACRLRCATYIDYVLEREGDVAAVVAETVRATPFIPPPDYWRIVREACDRHGALLILDEIPHGLGRTGTVFTFTQYGIVPDVVVLGKALGGGIFPLAALIAREGLNVAPEQSLGHYTHEKNPVACAAALAVLDELTETDLLAHVRTLGTWAQTQLEAMQARHPLIGNVRGLGLLLGVELVTAGGQRALEAAERVLYECLTRGLSFKVTQGNLLTLTPPLVITQAQMAEALTILEAALTVVEQDLR